ncbi:hypothetical protein QTH87_01420 [Variovorax sp. J22P168]|uniref:hypothetical protein n=1 Tax=Variovorax jilinensis TaxID=3053513 RepID=UPI002575D1F7|nr:hypothetical protein [Variovorax sp. J22P168]MDM0011085.1 hypothetical protein [Variovorax sp. J22P168]
MTLRNMTPIRQIVRLYSAALSATQLISKLTETVEASSEKIVRSIKVQTVAIQAVAAQARAPAPTPASPAATPGPSPAAEWLRRFAAPSEELLLTDPACYVNWLGLETEAGMFGNADQIRGKVLADLPLHDDGVYGGNAEYTSLLKAIDASSDRKRFVAVELGAGWGPWISAVGIVCKRLGVKDIQLVGVEAHDAKAEMMRQHLTRNGLMNVDGVHSKVMLGAAWKEDTELRFPKIDVRDHGGAATAHEGDVDYRGHEAEHVAVQAFSVPTICAGLGFVDYMHWDIQGAELETARASIDFLQKNVRYLFIGTHSRAIEGHLLELFYARKWEVLLQTPCVFDYDKSKPTLEAMTRTDGEIFLRNPHFVG